MYIQIIVYGFVCKPASVTKVRLVLTVNSSIFVAWVLSPKRSCIYANYKCQHCPWEQFIHHDMIQYELYLIICCSFENSLSYFMLYIRKKVESWT